MKNIFKAVAIVTIFSVLTRALGFLFRIFLSRKLGALGLGMFQMASSVLGLFLTLVSSGFPLVTAKSVAKYTTTNDLTKKYKTVSSALIISIIIAILSSLLIYVLKNFFNIILTDSKTVEILIVLIPSILFSAIYAIFRGALWGNGDYFNCGLTELIEQILRFVLTFIFLINITETFTAVKNSAIAFNITCLLSSAITIFIYFKQGNRLIIKKGEYKNLIKSALPITGIRVASSLVQPLTSLLIPNLLIFSGFSSIMAIESYGVIMGMTFPLLFVPMTVVGSFSMVLIPSISSLLAKNNYTEIENNIKTTLQISIFLSIIFVILYIAVGDLIGLVLYNNALSGILLQVAGICVLPITLCNLSSSFLDALNLEFKSFINYIIGSFILFISLIIFTPLVGINSIIISFSLSMSTISILNLKKIKKTIPTFNIKFTNFIFKVLLISLPTSLLGNFTAKILLHFFTPFFSGLIGGATAILSFLILTKIFNLFNLKQLFSIIKSAKKKV